MVEVPVRAVLDELLPRSVVIKLTTNTHDLQEQKPDQVLSFLLTTLHRDKLVYTHKKYPIPKHTEAINFELECFVLLLVIRLQYPVDILLNDLPHSLLSFISRLVGCH